MKNLRKLHLYLGCLFAPLIIYFSLSGIWQIFRFNDVEEEPPVTASIDIKKNLHEWSKPHTNATLPGGDPKTQRSVAFAWASLLMGIGMTLTSALGILIALRSHAYQKSAMLCLGMGVLIPSLLLLLR